MNLKKSKTICIIGGQGLIGQEYQKLSKNNYSKIILDKKIKKKSYVKNKIKYFNYDCLNYKSKNNQIARSDIIIFMVGKIGGPESLDIKNFEKYFQVNCNSLINTIKKINKKKTKKIIFLSTEHVYGDFSELSKSLVLEQNPKNYYGVTKLISEKLLYKFFYENKISVDILRFPRVIIPSKNSIISNFLKKIINKEKINISNTKLKLNFIYIDDLISSIDECSKKLNTNFRILNIFNRDKPLSLIGIIKEFKRLSNFKVKFVIKNKLILPDHNPILLRSNKNETLNKRFNWSPKFNNKKIFKKIIDNEIK
jgi:nucleoside-diphosphate-sugar epimerase